MDGYTQLTREQRYQIYAYGKAGLNQSETARQLQVHKSTISREMGRNRGRRGYRPKQAQTRCDLRRAESYRARIGVSEWERVEALIRREWSPVQVRDRLAEEGQRPISHEWIYQYLCRDKQAGGTLYRFLRCQRQRRKRYGRPERRGQLVERVSIEERPAIVERRSRIGDWEGDTLIGRHQRGVLVSLVERKSGYTVLAALRRRTASAFREATVRLLRPHQARVHTLTLDNGKEGAQHERIASSLDARVYFAHPYCSWERGTNENTNGLIRQYFPKRRNLTTVTQRELDHAMHRLNHRPRKRLGFKTPYEVFFR
ncbi:MAG: IS30 family transposase, partial [Gammaproteobacteria bacterium]|nr:IS30 family transposase [Gammaproteobacteria bacterium]